MKAPLMIAAAALLLTSCRATVTAPSSEEIARPALPGRYSRTPTDSLQGFKLTDAGDSLHFSFLVDRSTSSAWDWRLGNSPGLAFWDDRGDVPSYMAGCYAIPWPTISTYPYGYPTLPPATGSVVARISGRRVEIAVAWSDIGGRRPLAYQLALFANGGWFAWTEGAIDPADVVASR